MGSSRATAARGSQENVSELLEMFVGSTNPSFSMGDALLVGNTKGGETFGFELDLHVKGGNPAIRTEDYLVTVRSL